MIDVSTAPAPGWYPDPFGRARQRWWDGAAWGETIADSSGTRLDRAPGSAATPPLPAPVAARPVAPLAPPPGRPAPPTAPSRTSPPPAPRAARVPRPAAVAATAVPGVAASALSGGLGAGGWQVVVGPRLPAFPALRGSAGGRGIGRLLGGPALLAVTTLLTVVPALLTETPGPDALAYVRLGLGLLAAGAMALVGRFSGGLRRVAVAVPFVFVAVQVVVLVVTVLAWRSGESTLGAALPQAIGVVATVVAALRAVRGARAGRRA